MIDPHRPRYHFMPAANWMNDPNGLIHWKGVYHLFFQHNPNRACWGLMHWGHAISRDLVYWERMPIAMAPSPDSPDADGCFSGCAVDFDGVPSILYTGVFPEVQCLAISTDDLKTIQKYPGNPVIAKRPSIGELEGFRDPYVWRDGEFWYMIIGSGIVGYGGAILLYQSKDLVDWKYLHPLCVGERTQSTPFNIGTMWECPQFFPMGEEWALVISVMEPGHNLYTLYYLGEFKDLRFYPRVLYKLDHGDSTFYAPQVFRNQDNQRIMFGWIQERRSQDAQLAAGWSGVMSLPRILYPLQNERMGMAPWPELVNLREDRINLQNLKLAEGQSQVVIVRDGSSFELEAKVGIQDNTAFELQFCTTDYGEMTSLTYSVIESLLSVNTTRSSLSTEVTGNIHSFPIHLSPGETLDLHIYVDGSVLEVFANGWATLTSRFYPTGPVQPRIRLDPLGKGVVSIGELNVWNMKSIF